MVAGELARCADLLQEKEDDSIRIFDEVKQQIDVDYSKLADEQFHLK